MNEKIRNWIKRWGITLWLVAVAVLLATLGSFAAYTSFNSVKRVVSTGKAGNTLFSSNYLSLVSLDSNVYPTRRIAPSEAEDNCTVIIHVCNYVYGNTTAWNTKNITYTFTVKVVSRDGSELSNVNGITIKQGETLANNSGDLTYIFSAQTLSKDSANMNVYTITVPSTLKDKIKLEIVAEPNAASWSATNQQKLAANITLSTPEPTKNWTGRILDDDNYLLSEYDAFNYEISGNGAGTVTLKWNSDILQASKWFIDEYKPITSTNENGVNYTSISFPVGASDEAPTAYQLQFYKVPGATIPDDWEKPNELEKCVEVRFEAN